MNHVKTITFTIVLLSIISIVNLYNAKYLNIIYKYYYIKQLIFYILGLIISILLKKLNLKILFKHSKYLYIFNILLLLLVLVYGQNINGSKAWFDFGFFSFQPSELMKYSLCIFLIEESYRNENKYKNILRLFIYTLIPTVLVFLEPDTGAIIMYLVIYLASLFYSLKKKKLFYIFCIIGCVILSIFVFLYFKNIDLLIKILGTSIFYRIDRIIDFKDNYQLENALISIGTSNMLGRNKPMIYIPESVTDFMFARVVASYGFFSGIILIICYFIILLYIVNSMKTNKNKIFVFSFFWLFLFQIIQNIFMNIGLLPIMGIPLPFLSYGGSNTIIYFLLLSIILKQEKNN